MLDKLLPMSWPYPVRGAIIRAVRTGIAILLAGVTTSIADGSLIAGISFLPVEYKPFVILALSAGIAAVDKFLRERDLVGNEDDDIPLSDNSDEVDADVPDKV